MAKTIQVDGIATIQVCIANGGTLADLGYTINGVEIREETFSEDIHGDQNGGDAGPPIDVEVYGEIHRIQLTLSKWDEAVANIIRANVAGGTAGVPPTPGTLLFAGGHAFRLAINSVLRPRNYPIVLFLKEPKEVNKGTRFSRLVLTGVAYKNGSNILYDTNMNASYAYVAP